MEELLIAPSTTVVDSEPPTEQLRPRTNHLLQGVLAFLAVVGIGATITVLLSPPVQVRVITVEKQKPPEIHYVERVVEKSPRAVEKPPIQLPARRPPKTTVATKPNPVVMRDCGDDILCGIDKGKQ